MFFSLRVSFSVLNVILVYARPENLFSYESTGSDWNEAGWNNDPLNDPLEGNLFSDSADLDAFASDFTLDSWDYASLPNSCDTQGSLTDDLLQARDDSSCPPKKKEENINLPTGLFQDPLQYLNDGLKTPPKGEEDRPGQESQGGDFNFGAFMNSRPKSALPYNVDESLCPPEAYGLSTTPVCHYPNRGLSTAVGATGTTLYDVSPYLPIPGCLQPSKLWCCKDILSRSPDRTPANDVQVDTSGMSPEQVALLFGMLHGFYDAYECFLRW